MGLVAVREFAVHFKLIDIKLIASDRTKPLAYIFSKKTFSNLQEWESLNTKGIFKRQKHFYYTVTQNTIKHATADVGLMFTAMNLRRIMNIVGLGTLKVYLRELIAILKSFLSFLELSKQYRYPDSILQFFITSYRLIIHFLNFKLILRFKPMFETGF